MNPVELRQDRKSMGCMLVLLGLVASGILCILFLFRNLNFTPFKIILLLAACMLILMVWKTATQLKRNRPLLILFKEGLEINESFPPVMILWQDVISWDVRKQDATHYLILKTAGKRYSINISWLQVPPEEVKALMETFMHPDAGSGGNQ